MNKQMPEFCGLPVRMTVTFGLLKALREKGYSCHGHTARSGTVAIASSAAVRGSLKIENQSHIKIHILLDSYRLSVSSGFSDHVM